MKTKDDGLQWIPLWVDKWIFGSTRLELQHDERAIFTDLLALASKDSGYIRANLDTEYRMQQLAGLLCATEELVERTIRRCIETGKISKSAVGAGYYVSNWEEYQLSRRHKQRFYKVRHEEKKALKEPPAVKCQHCGQVYKVKDGHTCPT